MTSSSGEVAEKVVSMKRKRSSSDEEDWENMPPLKISPRYMEASREAEASVDLQSSSPYASPSDDDVIDPVTIATEPLKSTQPESEYTVDSGYSPASILELAGVLSPLENVPRGDSTPHSSKRSKSDAIPARRKCPLPGLSWADPSDVWKRMCESDARSTLNRNSNMFDNHPNLQPRMRAILLDWLNEVCEVYKLHRETFHLTVDYLDRYLSKTEDLPKGQLQLIGITCLFIAAKVEEVYPPKIGEFAYVTDGACTQEQILAEEIIILKILSWSITPLTINSWLNVYMQLSSEARSAKRRLLTESDSGINSLRGYTFVFPQYSSLEFAISGQLIDLAVLHVDVNNFSYSVVAAAAMAHTFSKELALRVSGYSWDDLEVCYKWLSPFVDVVRAEGAVRVVRTAETGGDFMQGSGGLALICPDINLDESHRIQVHNIDLDMFDKVSQQISEKTETVIPTEATPTTSNAIVHPLPLTPPQSDHKSPKTPLVPTPSTRHCDVEEVA